MEFPDDEATPEEQRAALIAALQAKLGGQQQVNPADFSRGWGNMNMRSGDRVLGALGQSQIQQAGQMDAMSHQAKQAGLAQAIAAQREKTRRAQELFDTKSQRAYQEQRDTKQNAAEMERARILAGLKAAEKAAPRAVTVAEAAEIGALNSGVGAVDELGKAWDDDTGAFSGIMQYVPGSDAKQYSGKADVAAQVVGGILEGGKLGEADLPRYKAMMPQPGDSKETKAKKVKSLKEMLELKRTGKLQGLGDAGYDVGGFEAQAPKGGNFDLGEQDAAALAWARANPQDPRAAAIMKKLGAR